MHRIKFGFTLVEILITLAVIGIVSVLTIPTLISNINERSNSERAANIVQKIDKSMNVMRADGKLLTVYNSTDEFVDELQNYLKISSRCDSEHIDDCWPTDYVMTTDGEKYNISKAKIGVKLGFEGRIGENVGIILTDGSSLILSYNPNSEAISDSDSIEINKAILPVGFGKTKEYVYGSSAMSPIAFIMDVNGNRLPNSEPKDDKIYDIRDFGGA